ncbi:hypothetical protein SAMN05660477_00824 [Soonwooa buanensis]|uniref:Uncharacterized protein n=1 Tax=Soonwooa buanensis TaxID=619805 RepID=A0A1T5DLQ4_9FLAO|nr:hypothetical protein [Soonwooa buanensis]SKB72608.1 hypothetical protein SAMN05660477_00824 [Soonwooa buanensis]
MEDTLTSIRTRVRFKLKTSLTPDEYSENIKNYLKENNEEFTGNINREVATIFVKNDNNNYWKPNLALRTEIEEGQTYIRGIFGPSSAVWTFFMFLYFIFSILWMTFFTMYYVEKQINSNDFPWALSASFVALALVLGTYIAAQIGQRLSKEEMKKLRKFAEESTLPHEMKPNEEV